MKSQASQAITPWKRSRLIWATAIRRPITAMLPLSKYSNGALSVLPASRRLIRRATKRPCCIATGA